AAPPFYDCAKNIYNIYSMTTTPQAKFIRMKSASKKRAPSIVNLTVKRRYLTEREDQRLIDCSRKYGRYGHRDATMILVAYRHGLRGSEVCDLQWEQIELSEGRLHVHRVKNGISSARSTRTCFAMPVGTSSPTMATTRGPCSTTSGTRPSGRPRC